MISESQYWKEPLLDLAKQLKSLTAKPEMGDAELAQLERDVFIAFYSVRKLFETPFKTSDKTKKENLNLSWFKNIRTVTWLNNHKLAECYDLCQAHREIRSIPYVCGRIVHSHIFMPAFDDYNRLEGFFFNSDHDKDQRLYKISIHEVIRLFDMVGNDYPTSGSWAIDPESGEETFTSKRE